MSTSFNFANKENATHLSRGAPKTPLKSKSIIFRNNNNNNENNIQKNKINVLKDGFKTPNNNIEQKNQRRVPLGGKDKNANVNENPLKISAGSLVDHSKGLTSSAAKRRIRRLRQTPLSTRPASKKLNILRDEPAEPEVNTFEPIDLDDEIEYVPEKEPELPYIPLNYEPFTEDELHTYKTASNPRTFDCRDEITPMTEDEIYEEYPINFDESDNESDTHSTTSAERRHPHFMEPTFVSNARSKNKKVDVYDDGLSNAELQRIIDEE